MAGTMTSSLLQLPNELLDHIFSFLDTAAPSESNFHSLPSWTCFARTQQPLKHVSLVSHRLRTVVVNRLFANVRIAPNFVQDFLQFINRAGLSWKVESILIEVSSHDHAGADPKWWCLLLDQVPTRRIVLQCQPEVQDELFGIRAHSSDFWAFKVPCQYIEFIQGDLPQRTDPCDASTGLLAARQCQSMRVNEGSSLAAYTSYEYFLKKAPSLVATLEDYLDESSYPLQHLPADGDMFVSSSMKITAALNMIENLQVFSYTAIFPFYNRVGEIMNCVKRMKSLRKLYVKLCPEPGSSILEDAIQAAGGHIDLNDPWSE